MTFSFPYGTFVNGCRHLEGAPEHPQNRRGVSDEAATEIAPLITVASCVTFLLACIRNPLLANLPTASLISSARVRVRLPPANPICEMWCTSR